MYFNIEINSLD